MSAVPRDQLFWKRFSVAIREDEESGVPRKEMKPSDSWLARQQSKRSRRGLVCWIFWIFFFCFIAGVVAVIIWLLKSGILSKEWNKIGNGNGTPNQPSNPNGGTMGGSRRFRL